MSLLDYSFMGEYELKFSAWGEGTLTESDLLDFQKPDTAFNEFMKNYRRYPRSISLLIEDSLAAGFDYGFTDVDTVFLEKLETLKELILPDSITHISLTPKLAGILKDNNTLIRGSFDSFAESFARNNGLHFRPSDYEFAYYKSHDTTVLTLVFKRSGRVYIQENISSPGSSAGNSFGGTFTYPLDRNFYKTKTVEQLARLLGSKGYDAAIKNGRLATFIEKARMPEHAYFSGKN